jgi:peptide/nickel transport system permease protein
MAQLQSEILDASLAAGAGRELGGRGHAQTVRRILRNRPLVIGGGIVLVLIFASLLAPYIAPYNDQAMNLIAAMQPPSLAHLAGTDNFGRDMFSRILFGGRVALLVGFTAVAISMVIGCLLGFAAGYAGGTADMLVQRVMDLMLAFPSLLLAFLVIAILGPGLVNAIIAIGVSGIPVYARLARAEVLKLRNREFVDAARAMGAGNSRVLLRHLIPNSLSPILVLAGLGIASAILTEAALSYIGLGAQPPSPDWGSMLSQAQNYIETQWWLPTFPGLAIVIAALGFNLLGDGLRDHFDPR